MLEELDQAKSSIIDLQKHLDKAEAEITCHQRDLQEVVLRARSIAKIDNIANLTSPIVVFECLLNAMEEKIKTTVRAKEEEVQTKTQQLQVKNTKLEEEMKEAVEVSPLRTLKFLSDV